jgi:long-chain acyl-CoA synthetase
MAHRQDSASHQDTATIVKLFADRVAADAAKTALHVRRGPEFITLTWSEIGSDVRRTAAALVELGVQPGDRVILVSPNRYEWIVCDMAIQMAQAVHVPVHASLAGAQIAYQILDSGAKLLLLSGPEQVEKLQPLVPQLPGDLKVVTFDACPEAWEHFTFRRWGELVAATDEAEGERVVERAVAAITPDSLATILYTSGTTGEPKGVMLSQRNLASNALASIEAFGLEPGDLRLTWLPLSHIFARTCDLYTWIAAGYRLALADAPESVVANCEELKPTLMNGVPYFFEKVQRRVVESGMADQPGMLSGLFGGKIRALISGGAALPDHVAEFYNQRGVKLLQGYGLTETSPVITTGTDRVSRLGTVGRPIPGAEVKISADGEVLTRGPHVMLGYWKNPQATSEVLRDGWLYTGDFGEIDADGFLRITGRKKELIVTAGGKNISPANLEALLTADPLIQQALVIGDGRNYLTALLVPQPEALRIALNEEGIDLWSSGESVPAAALVDPRVRRLFAQRIEQRLAGVSRYEQVRNFTLLDRGFSAQRGELTPTLKLRRQVILNNFAEIIEAMYESNAVISGPV